MRSQCTLKQTQGKDGSPATAASLRKAADILQESFDPIIDLSTGQDLLPVMVFALELGAWDYTGMYTILLKHQASSKAKHTVIFAGQSGGYHGPYDGRNFIMS